MKPTEQNTFTFYDHTRNAAFDVITEFNPVLNKYEIVYHAVTDIDTGLPIQTIDTTAAMRFLQKRLALINKTQE